MPHADSKIVGRCVLAAAIVALTLIAGGVAVLLGWALDIPGLKTIAVAFVSMKPISALCFVLAGVGLLARLEPFDLPFLQFAGAPRVAQVSHAIATVLIAIFAATALGEYLFGAQLGIDSFLMRDAVVAENTAYPGRMSPATATEFILAGLSLASLDLETRGRRRPSQWLALLIALIAFITFLGYLYDVDVLYKVNVYATMALQTTLFFLLLSAGLLLARPDKGLMAELTNTRVGAKMARSVLPFALLVPICIGWLRLQGERAGFYGEEFGLAIFAASNVLIFTILIWIAARWLNRAAIHQSKTQETVASTATELLKTVQQLEDSQERHRLAVEAADLGTWHLDFATGSMQLSDNGLRLYGFAPGTAVTRQKVRDIIHPDDQAQATLMRQRIEQGLGKFEIEYRVYWPDGSIHWLVVKGEGQYDDAGHATSIQGVVMDVTARKQDERDRERLQGQLRQSQKLNALGTLAAGIAHDFNNVLTAISGNATLAASERTPPLPQDVRDNLAEIDKAARRASDLVQRILAFGRGHDAKASPTPLQPIVEDAIKLLRASISPMIDLRIRSAADVPNVLIDATQIHQVIMNVATNAVHAIGEARGRIEFFLDIAQVDGNLAHSFAELADGQYVRLAIVDDGCGMEKAVIDRIFEPFYTTKAPGRGTGLGLSVAHGIVKSAAGAITVYSEVGKGSKFHIYLPATEATADNSARAETTVVMGNGERVLYVDDEEALIFLVTRLLERYNYIVTGYTDAAQALATFRGEPSAFDVVVTDLSMPQMSGFEFAKEILQIRPGIPVVLTSGYVRREDADVAKEIGIRQLLAKPNTVDELGGALSRLFASATK